jgi:hypothetical protein
VVRTRFAPVAGLLALAGMTLARPDEHGEGKPGVRALSAADIAEKIDGPTRCGRCDRPVSVRLNRLQLWHLNDCHLGA